MSFNETDGNRMGLESWLTKCFTNAYISRDPVFSALHFYALGQCTSSKVWDGKMQVLP